MTIVPFRPPETPPRGTYRLKCSQCVLFTCPVSEMSCVSSLQGVVVGVLAIVLSKNKKMKSLVSVSALCL